MNNMRNKILMTLALLLTAVGGAWAEEKSETISTTTSQEVYTGEHFKITTNKQDDMLTVADLRNHDDGQVFFFIETLDGQNISKLDLQINLIEDTSIDNLSLSSGTKSYDSNKKVLTITNVNADFVQITLTEEDQYGVVTISSVTYYYEESPAIDVTPVTGKTNEWTFTMPGSDVVLTPIYAKAAAFATTGTEPDVKTLLPEAAEGIIAGTDASLIAEGTGIVAFAGTSTEVKQGTVMYFATTDAEMTAEKAAQANGWLATVPTAEGYDDAQTVYVWYYIQGADTPEGQEATAENTFNDSEICTEPITVNVLSNKFDIQFKAANDNTIETGKATVTVGGTAATVTEGKLEDVKMGTEVKVTAKEGYKFRKVEVKKAAPATTVTWNSSDFYFDPNPYTKDGVTLTPSNEMAANGNNLYFYGDNTFTTTLGKFTKIEIVFESTTYTFDGWTKGTGEQYQPDPQTYPDWWENLLKLTWTGDAESVTIKGKDVLGIHSITFTIQ